MERQNAGGGGGGCIGETWNMKCLPWECFFNKYRRVRAVADDFKFKPERMKGFTNVFKVKVKVIVMSTSTYYDYMHKSTVMPSFESHSSKLILSKILL